MKKFIAHQNESGVVRISSLYYKDGIRGRLVFKYFDILMHDLDIGAIVMATLGGIGFVSLITVVVMQLFR